MTGLTYAEWKKILTGQEEKKPRRYIIHKATRLVHIHRHEDINPRFGTLYCGLPYDLINHERDATDNEATTEKICKNCLRAAKKEANDLEQDYRVIIKRIHSTKQET